MTQLQTPVQGQQQRTHTPLLALLVIGVFAASIGWFMVGIKDMALIDRDEPMIAEVARQMAHRHEWLTPHLPAWEEKSIFKPPLAMWVMGGSFKLLGVSELAARLPSVICSALTVTILFIAAERRWGVAAGLAAAACMGLPLLPAVAGRMALTDPLLTLLATIALLCLLAALGESRWMTCRSDSMVAHDATMAPGKARCGGSHLVSYMFRNGLMWVALGLGMLIKGPAILAFFGPAVVMAADRFRWKPYLVFAGGMALATWGGSLVLNEHTVPGAIVGGIGGLIVVVSLARWFLPVMRLPIGAWWGAPLMLATCGWWFAYISQSAGAVQQASAKRFILFEVLTRIAQPMEHHSGPPGYYLAIVLVGLLPLSALLPGVLTWAFRERKSDGTLQLLLAWVVGSWLLCEISSTKLPHYILPAWPALALLAGMWWSRAAEVRTKIDGKRALGLVVPGVVFSLIVAVVGVFAWRDDLRIWLGDHLAERQAAIWPYVAYLGKLESWQVGSLLAAPAILLVAAVGAWLLARRRSAGAGVAALAAGWVPALLLLVAVIMSGTSFSESLSRSAARQALAMGGPDSEYLAVGYTEPALFFYLPAGRYERIERAIQIQTLAKRREPFVLIASRDLEPAVREWLGGRIGDMRVVSGLNTARGRPQTACVFAVRAAPRAGADAGRGM